MVKMVLIGLTVAEKMNFKVKKKTPKIAGGRIIIIIKRRKTIGYPAL